MLEGPYSSTGEGANPSIVDYRSHDNVEEQLTAYLQRIEHHTLGWQAVYLHLSRLSPSNRKEYNIRIALSGLAALTGRREGRVFVLANHDVVVLVRGALVAEVNEAVSHIRFMFQDDVLAKSEDSFFSWYDVSLSFDELMFAAQRLVKIKARRRAEPDGNADLSEIRPLDPQRLGQLERSVTSLDLGPYLRRQPVCVIKPDDKPRPVFRELYVRIAELQRPLMPDVDFYANRWLFQHLTETLDARLLRLVARHPDEFLLGPVSLNLNVDTVLGQAFLNFDEALKPGMQRNIVIELQIWDIMADLGAFHFAREFARGRGYRMCIDGLSDRSLTLIDERQLGCDLVKLIWDDAIDHRAHPKADESLRRAIAAVGASRMILSRCGEPRAIEFGHDMGIVMFQGRFVDQLLNPTSRVIN